MKDDPVPAAVEAKADATKEVAAHPLDVWLSQDGWSRIAKLSNDAEVARRQSGDLDPPTDHSAADDLLQMLIRRVTQLDVAPEAWKKRFPNVAAQSTVPVPQEEDRPTLEPEPAPAPAPVPVSEPEPEPEPEPDAKLSVASASQSTRVAEEPAPHAGTEGLDRSCEPAPEPDLAGSCWCH